MEDGPAEIRGGGEDDEESGEKKIITWDTNLYPDSDDDSYIHDTEEEGEFEENFRRECRYHERLLSEYRAQEDQEIDESQREEELQGIASAWFQSGFVVARDSPTNIDDPMNDRLVVLPSRELIRRIEESGLDPSVNQGHEEDSGEGEESVENRSGDEKEVDTFRWFGRWKHETEAREWTKEEVAEHLAIVQAEADDESGDEPSDESSDWSDGGVIAARNGFGWGVPAREIHPIELMAREGGGWGRIRPKFQDLLPNDNVEDSEEDSGVGEESVENRSGDEKEVSVDASRWFGLWKNETKPREWTKEEVAEHLAILRSEADAESGDEPSDETSDWSHYDRVAAWTGLGWGRNIPVSDPIEGTAQEGGGWGRIRPKFEDLLPSDNVEDSEYSSGTNKIDQDSQPLRGGLEEESGSVTEDMIEEYIVSMVEAKASTASNEAPNGSPPPNSGSAAPSSPVARSSQAEEGSGVVQES